ncbi:amidase family protein [Paenibacillus spongiae]|uniref:Amidase n=1 Tax=Paenibacillus spongiae TaxID=2909671 RepID=A0ABY5S9U0_9BACL|nr:amidase family protein [Paenibacillus spongiae]UVI29310.1 amidase [Paenibacillus spongiae]
MPSTGGAFIREDLIVKPEGSGPLSGLSFAVKDVIAVAGHCSSAGNPDWLRTHEPADRHAETVVRLLRQGARLSGVTHTDELMYSLNGENIHYGTPVNPKAPSRIPGGSSSGSAAAVAAGAVDFALGTDTGGSVRVPSSYCGILGFRPTHDAIPMDGVIPLAPGFDTLGWMAADPEVLLTVGRALLAENDDADDASKSDALDTHAAIGNEATVAMPINAKPVRAGFERIYMVREAWELADAECGSALADSCTSIASMAEKSGWIAIAPEGLAEWMNAFRTIQGIEIWTSHGQWIEDVRPVFGPGIAQRFAWASTLTEQDGLKAAAFRDNVRSRMAELLRDDTLLLVPTVPGPAPLLGLTGEELERRRERTLQLTCIAGLGGLPQLTIPLADRDGAPIGLSIIAGRGQDLKLLEWAADFVGTTPFYILGK